MLHRACQSKNLAVWHEGLQLFYQPIRKIGLYTQREVIVRHCFDLFEPVDFSRAEQRLRLTLVHAGKLDEIGKQQVAWCGFARHEFKIALTAQYTEYRFRDKCAIFRAQFGIVAKEAAHQHVRRLVQRENKSQCRYCIVNQGGGEWHVRLTLCGRMQDAEFNGFPGRFRADGNAMR